MHFVAQAGRRNRIVVGVIAVTFVVLGAYTSSASAQQLPPYFYSGSFTDGTGSTGGTFSSTIDRIDYDNDSEKLYVLDPGKGGGVLTKLNQDGLPRPFTYPPLAGASSIVIGSMGTVPSISVDNSPTATQGNIYVVSQSQAKLFGFGRSGAPLAGFPISGLSNPCGVAVDPQGDVWVSEMGPTPKVLREYSPVGLPTGNAISGLSNPCNVAIDTNGYFYIAQNTNRVRKYSPSGAFIYDLNAIRSEDIAIDPTNNHVFVVENQNIVRQYSSTGALQAEFGLADAEHSYLGLQTARGIAVDPVTHDIWVANRREYAGVRHVERFTRGAAITVPTVLTEKVEAESTSAIVKGVINPEGVATTDCHIDWGTTVGFGSTVPCLLAGVPTTVFTGSSDQAITASIPALVKGNFYYARVSAKNANNKVMTGGMITFRAASKPILTDQSVSDVNTDGAKINTQIDPNGGTTSYYIEYGTDLSYGSKFPPAGEVSLSSLVTPQSFNDTLAGLTPGTEYHYRIVAQNETGTTVGNDRVFKTYLPTSGDDPCPNAQVRQQTGSGLLLDCRAYELVSAANTGGYDVESDLIPGQAPLSARPDAADRLLYSVHAGSVPGVAGNPTNFDRDPYVAQRGASGWSTRYVGLPANGMTQEGPFASPLLGADAGLEVFAFGGPNICDPCFEDGSTNVPLRLSDGTLVKGMAGPLNPAADPGGFVAEPFSADGSHFVFGATSKFTSNGNEGSLSIYDRDLTTNTTQLVSTLPDSSTMEGGAGVGELDISTNGSQIIVAALLGEDEAGNKLWHPYMHIGENTGSYDLAPNTTTGVQFAGMTTDGSRTFFTSKDKLTGSDTDTSADLYEAAVSGGGGLTLSLLSTGASPPVGNEDGCDPFANADGNNWNAVGGASTNDCGVVAIAGGGGLAKVDGTIYFLSPEKLDEEGTPDAPNLFVVRPGEVPHLVATLEPNDSVVRNAVKDSEAHRYGDFQVTSNGNFAAFNSATALTGFPTSGHIEIYRYDAVADEIQCVSCPLSFATPTTDSTLAPYGLSLDENGKVFFTSSEPMVLRDTNHLKDVYEWSDGVVELISTGDSPFDSGVLSTSADGKDVFFFTHATLSFQDENGNTVKVYSAREGGGYLYDPPPFPCAASDECHGPGTQAAGPPNISTVTPSLIGSPQATSCKKGFSKKRGRCVKKKKKKKSRKRATPSSNRAGG
jgi:hypothetical protein